MSLCCRFATSRQSWARAWARIWTKSHPMPRGQWSRADAKASSCPACWLAVVLLVDDLSCLIVPDRIECKLCQCFVYTVVNFADHFNLQIMSICNNSGRGPEFLLMLMVFKILRVSSIHECWMLWLCWWSLWLSGRFESTARTKAYWICNLLLIRMQLMQWDVNEHKCVIHIFMYGLVC